MKKEKNSSAWYDGMLFGCVTQIIIFVAFTMALQEDTMVSTAAYAIIVCPFVLLLRWLLHKFGVLDGGWYSRLFGPAVLVILATLAIKFPIKVKDENGEEVIVTPKIAADATAEKIVAAIGPDGKDEAGSGSSTNAAPGIVERLGEVPPGVSFTPPPDGTNSVEAALAELNELIGLKEVKAEVEKFVKIVQVNKLREAEGLKVPKISYHMVFTGNPGTGKTTVARIMAKIYHALGIVKVGHLVETDKGGLIAEYVGQTAVKTAKVIDFAMDGVLFIDEAYAITEGDGKNGYGSECIATLLKRMEDNRDRLVVIVAGYTDEMKRFIDTNPGLESRFNRYIHFPDYTAEELADIFRLRAKSAQYVLSKDVEHWIVPYIGLMTKERDKKFGNGRWVRNLFEKSIERQAMRLADLENPTREQLMTITMRDVGISLKNPDASDED